MEEDIEALKIWIREVRTGGLCIVLHKNSEVLPVLENLIKGYKELEEKADRLGKLYYEANENCIKYEKDYMPKSKVREIIEDIDNNKPVIAELKLRKLVEGDK